MTRRPVTIFALFALAGLTACFGSHGSDDDGPTDDAPRIDAGPPPLLDGGRMPRPLDGSVLPPDAGPDLGAPPPSCSRARADVSCGGTPYPSGVPFELPVSIGGDDSCYCGELVECRSRLEAGPDGGQTVHLETFVCAGDVLCDGCFPYIDGKCAIPALPGGSYPVFIDGDHAFDLDVTEADFEPVDSCTTVAEPDPLGCGPVSWPPSTFEARELCHPETVGRGQRATLTVVDTCGSCGQQPGPCEVVLDETGFSPVLRVQATNTFTACDVDCPSICMRHEHECVIPSDLGPGSYGVVVNGRDFGSRIEVGDFTSGEICGGVLEDGP